MADSQINGHDSYRDASFSYLRSDQTLVHKTPSSRERRKTEPEGEISVFGAERYFNTILVEDHQHQHQQHYPDLDHECDHDRRSDHQRDQINRPGTPSACSDRSTAFLLKSTSGNNLIRNPSDRKHHNRKRKVVTGPWSFFATLGCMGTCTDEKSINVDHADQDRSSAHPGNGHDQPNRLADDHRLRYEARSTKRQEDQHFAFPILSDSVAVEEKNVMDKVNGVSEPPRASLEVFGSKAAAKKASYDEVTVNLERKLSVLTWDAIPAKPYNNRVSPRTGRAGTHEDAESDASSDLFEIENITTGARRASDSISRCGDYEPSEGSVEWSVVTASAIADLGAEYDEKKVAVTGHQRLSTRPPVMRRRASTGMLGCKNQKSVSIAEAVHISGGGRKYK